MSSQHRQRDTYSLKSIYQAIQNPRSSTANHCMANLQKSPTKEIDHTLRKLHSYVKHSHHQWPERRLVRCLDYIFIHGIKHHLEERIQLSSFKANVRWILDMIRNTTATGHQEMATDITLQIQSAVKFICGLFESVRSQIPDSPVLTSLLADMRRREGVRSLLSWSQSSVSSIRIYCVRALTAQLAYFARDMIALNAYESLSRLLHEMPGLLITISLRPPVTDVGQRRAELDQCVMICRLFEGILKYEPQTQPSESRRTFAESEAFQTLVGIWQAVCSFDYQTRLAADAAAEDNNNNSDRSVKNQGVLVYSITVIVQRCVHVSTKAASYVAELQVRTTWQNLLALCMQNWIRNTCCTTTITAIPTTMLDKDKGMMKKLIQISLNLVPVLLAFQQQNLQQQLQETHWLPYVDRMVLTLTNFIMAYVSQPILPEQASMVGTTDQLLSTDLCIDVEERGYELTAHQLNEHQDLFVLLLESFIQYIPLASAQTTQRVASRVAWCLKSILTILLTANALDTSVLRSRILRLIVFLLHYQDAIEVLATSTTNITELVWGPTIDLAKQGLLTIAALATEDELTAAQAAVISKAKRALVALEKVSRHPRACERLVDCDVLQLVDVALVPSGEVLEKSRSVLAVYGLFGQFVASLSRRTAFVRIKLRDDCSLFPMVMRLMDEAIRCRETRRRCTSMLEEDVEEEVIVVGWNHVIASCLQVVSAFQYDETSMRLWLVYGEDEKRSILPFVLAVLFPWKQQQQQADVQRYWDADHQVIYLAAQVLDQLSTIPVCGRQLIMVKDALLNLSRLMITLTVAVDFQQHQQHPSVTSSALPQEDVIMMEEPVQQVLSAILSMEDIDSIAKPATPIHEPRGEPKANPTLNYQCADSLRRSAVRMLSAHDNTQFVILSDAFTSFFGPLLTHPDQDTTQAYWRHIVSRELHDKKMHEFKSLYRFTSETAEAVKLHEFSAIAVGYAVLGIENAVEWNQTLGLTVVETSMVSTNHVLAIFCQMLLYELEYEEDDQKEEKQQQQENDDSLLTMITPFRRHAAAQMLEMLALEFEERWSLETEMVRASQEPLEPVEVKEPDEQVSFMTDDAPVNTYISASRPLLRARSAIFEALLSGDYAESTMTAIPLHDVSFRGLKLFIDIIHKLNSSTATEDGRSSEVMTDSITWKDVIDLLHISDRFGSAAVKQLCETWVVEKVKRLGQGTSENRLVCLEGLVELYRHCRDPIEKDGGISSQTWPFAVVTRESLKAIVQYLTEASQTEAFLLMVQEKDVEELDAFCNGLACLLRK
ncbi:MAG: hypothetical protein EXX96DRAFT_578897 [Benjaminiella poitrasii]|nr:MAG: hypothetical protein EXX96DRAFT_578897 [Benjaminiella poitrasii]